MRLGKRKKKIPKSAEKWVKKEKVEFAELHNTNEDENFEDEEEEELDDVKDEDLGFETEDSEDER